MKGATAAGLTIARIEIDPTGKIVLVAATEVARETITKRAADNNEWDEVLK